MRSDKAVPVRVTVIMVALSPGSDHLEMMLYMAGKIGPCSIPMNKRSAANTSGWMAAAVGVRSVRIPHRLTTTVTVKVGPKISAMRPPATHTRGSRVVLLPN